MFFGLRQTPFGHALAGGLQGALLAPRGGRGEEGGPRGDFEGPWEGLGEGPRGIFFCNPRHVWVPSSHDKFFFVPRQACGFLRHVLALLRLSTCVASFVVCLACFVTRDAWFLLLQRYASYVCAAEPLWVSVRVWWSVSTSSGVASVAAS